MKIVVICCALNHVLGQSEWPAPMDMEAVMRLSQEFQQAFGPPGFAPQNLGFMPSPFFVPPPPPRQQAEVQALDSPTRNTAMGIIAPLLALPSAFVNAVIALSDLPRNTQQADLRAAPSQEDLSNNFQSLWPRQLPQLRPPQGLPIAGVTLPLPEPMPVPPLLSPEATEPLVQSAREHLQNLNEIRSEIREEASRARDHVMQEVQEFWPHVMAAPEIARSAEPPHVNPQPVFMAPRPPPLSIFPRFDSAEAWIDALTNAGIPRAIPVSLAAMLSPSMLAQMELTGQLEDAARMVVENAPTMMLTHWLARLGAMMQPVINSMPASPFNTGLQNSFAMMINRLQDASVHAAIPIQYSALAATSLLGALGESGAAFVPFPLPGGFVQDNFSRSESHEQDEQVGPSELIGEDKSSTEAAVVPMASDNSESFSLDVPSYRRRLETKI